MEELRIDLSKATPAEQEEGVRQAQLCFRFNHTMPFTPEYDALAHELFAELGEGSRVNAPITVVRGNRVRIGRNCVVMNGALFMGAGGITIDDDVLVAAHVKLISNNHDLQNLAILTCKPVHLCRGCWIGAGATILPGVTVGEHAVVGAGAVVTKDVEPYTVVGGNPAHLLKRIDAPSDN